MEIHKPAFIVICFATEIGQFSPINRLHSLKFSNGTIYWPGE